MKQKFYELADNRILGMDVFEVSSLPSVSSNLKSVEGCDCERIYNEFEQLLTELYRLVGENVCIEILWITEKVDNQTFESRIRLFFVVRKIGKKKEMIAYELNNIKKNLLTSICAMQFGVRDEGDEELVELLERINDSCVYSVVKSEKCIANTNSIYPYYCVDVIPNKNTTNFNSLISALSQNKECCISFQLFPVKLTQEEICMINEASGELERITSGTMINGEMYRDVFASEPLKAYTYYNEHRNAPLFSYNILVFGERARCASITTKVLSLLQSGTEKIVNTEPTCLDLSQEKIKLRTQFPFYVWNVNTRLMYYYRNKNLQSSIPLAKKLFRLPYIVTVEEAAAFFRLPLYDRMMLALRSNQVTQVGEQFSSKVVNENNIQIGKLITNDSLQIMIGCSEKAFTKHALVVGTPGSGKTTFSVNLLLQFVRRGIPFLAIEPTKAEYRAMIDAIPNLRIFTPGNNTVAPYIINPFIPPKGIRIEQYIPSLASAFKAAFSMPSPLDMIFLKAIRSCYTQYGWKDYSMLGDEDVELFGLYEFILVFKKMMENMNYSKEVRGNIESAGLLRLTNLIEQNSNIYDSIHTVPIEDLLTAPTVLELNSIDNAEQKALIIALLLINICIYTKHNHTGDGELKNAILIDEAHVLLGASPSGGNEGNADSQGTTIKALQDMIAEIRSYGTSIIIADQSAMKVSREVVANTDIKVSFRLVQSVDKELIADSTNMDEEAKGNLSKLRPGEAYVYYSQLDTPQMIMTEDIREKEGIRLSVSDEEVAKRGTYWNEHLELLRPYRECKLCDMCKITCNFKIRSNAEFIADSALSKYRTEIKTSEDFRKCIYHLPDIMKKEFEKYEKTERMHLQMCARIKLMRKISLELPVTMTEKEKTKVLTMFPEE